MWRCCGLKAAEVLWGQGLCLEACCPATLRCHRWRSSSWKFRFGCLEAKSRRGRHGYRRFRRAEKTVLPQFLDKIIQVMELEPQERINESIVEVLVLHVREETEEVINRDQFLDRCSCGTGMNSWEKSWLQCLRIFFMFPCQRTVGGSNAVRVSRQNPAVDFRAVRCHSWRWPARFHGFLPGQGSSAVCWAEHRISRGSNSRCSRAADDRAVQWIRRWYLKQNPATDCRAGRQHSSSWDGGGARLPDVLSGTIFGSVFREQTLDFDVPLRQEVEGVFIQDKAPKSASQERIGELFVDMPVPQICQRDGGDGQRRWKVTESE